MRKITYKEAAQMMDVPYEYIAKVVHRGVLTKCLIDNNRPMLLEDQVKLFRAKPGIGLSFLDADERQKWRELKNIANGSVQMRNDKQIVATEPHASIIKQIANEMMVVIAKQHDEISVHQLRKIARQAQELKNSIEEIIPHVKQEAP